MSTIGKMFNNLALNCLNPDTLDPVNLKDIKHTGLVLGLSEVSEETKIPFNGISV